MVEKRLDDFLSLDDGSGRYAFCGNPLGILTVIDGG